MYEKTKGTGAIGSALMEKYGQKKNVVIFGLTRKALSWRDFVGSKAGKLPLVTFLCSVAFDIQDVADFIGNINFEEFSRVTYVHCVGAYLFEIDSEGHFEIEGDNDKDGINDVVKFLSYDVLSLFSKNIILRAKNNIDCVIFGGLADRHQPRILYSWWNTMEKTEAFMKENASGKVGMFKFDISSVFCPHELLMRPFVFTQTDADQTAWLSPSMLASEVVRTLNVNNHGGFHKNDVFRHWEGFSAEYYMDQQMVPRRLAETINK